MKGFSSPRHVRNFCGVLVCLFACCVALSATQARLGETVDQCDARYGTPKKVGHEAPLSAQTRTYAKGDLIVTVGFNAEGLAEDITYCRTLGADLTKDEQAKLMEEESAGSAWAMMGQPTSEQTLWKREDGNALACYMTPSHWLTFITQAYYEKSFNALPAERRDKIRQSEKP